MLLTATGTADPDLVWQHYVDPSAWPTWSPQMRRVEHEGPLRVGSTGTIHPTVGPALHYRIDALDEATRSWSWTVGAGPAQVRLDHAVVPRPGGRVMATMRNSRATGTVVVPGYGPFALAALRRLVSRSDKGAAAVREKPAEDVRELAFAFAPAHARASRLFGITPGTSGVEVGPRWLFVRYGPWHLLTPRANVAGAEVTGGFSLLKTAGPPHLSFADRGVSFTTNGRTALCVRFHEPVPALEPSGALRHPAATLSVADPELLRDILLG